MQNGPFAWLYVAAPMLILCPRQTNKEVDFHKVPGSCRRHYQKGNRVKKNQQNNKIDIRK